jgi:histidine ammonia-lyase
MSRFEELTLIETSRRLREHHSKVDVTGTGLRLSEFLSVARNWAPVDLSNDPAIWTRVQTCYETMIEQIRSGVPIYGCNTGYGHQASMVLNQGTPEERLAAARSLSDSMDFLDVTVGPPLPSDIVRGAMVIRLNTLINGVSAATPLDLHVYTCLLNSGLVPVVNQYGGIGASGDLAHNARVLSVARQRPGALVVDRDGREHDAATALRERGIPPIDCEPKAGLCFVNGDNFSSSAAVLLAVDTLETLMVSDITSAMMIEALLGTNRSFHPMVAQVRQHRGQGEAAALYRFLLEGSRLAHQELRGSKPRRAGIKVQDVYSLRCLAQYQGANYDSLHWIFDVLEVNINGVSDNPLWVDPAHVVPGEEPWQWISGGNFIAMYMVEVMDRLRKILTQITKLCDRHLAQLVDRDRNNGLPANLSGPGAVSMCAFKGIQIQSGMFDVYSSILSVPVSTFFGVHEEANQDITSHALTSAILGIENLRVARYALAQNLLAVAQAIDLRGGPSLLAPATRPLYYLVRSVSVFSERERSLAREIEQVYRLLVGGRVQRCLLEEVYPGFEG